MHDEQNRIRNELERVLPELSSSKVSLKSAELDTWIHNLGEYIKNLKTTNQQHTPPPSPPSNNIEHSNSSEINNVSNKNKKSNNIATADDDDDDDESVDYAHYNSVLKQNEKLQETLDSYRKVLTETVWIDIIVIIIFVVKTVYFIYFLF